MNDQNHTRKFDIIESGNQLNRIRKLDRRRSMEEVLVSAYITFHDIHFELGGRVKPDMFHYEDTKLAITYVQEQIEKGHHISVAGLKSFLEGEFEMELPDDWWVVEMQFKNTSRTTEAIHQLAKSFATSLADTWERRMIKAFGSKIAESAEDRKQDPHEHIAELLAWIREKDGRKKDTSIQRSLRDFLDEIDQRQLTDKKITGVPTGYNILDAATGGWQDTDMIVIGGRPGMGKTTFALNLIWNASRSNKKAGIISIEMDARQLTAIFVSMLTGIGTDEMKARKMTEGEMTKITTAADKVHQSDIFIDDESTDLEDIIRTARIWKHKENIDVLMLDYIQLTRCKGTHGRYERITEVSNQLKTLAKELRIPIFVLSQLSRKSEERGTKDRKPQLSDLKDSGAIEQDADIIIFPYRYAYYNGREDDNKSEIIIAKFRNGKVGTYNFNTNGRNWYEGSIENSLSEDPGLFQESIDEELPF